MNGTANERIESKGRHSRGTGVRGQMAEQAKLVVMAGRKSGMQMGQSAVREGSTGRVVGVVPRIWAVGAGPERVASTPAKAPGSAGVPAGELAFYRKYTEKLLQRYMQMSMEAGRVPSMMGKEVLGGRASSYQVHGFDDAVNFRIDVERCLAKLDPEERAVVRRVALQEYTQAEAAAVLGISLRTCVQRYGRSLDRLTRILLDVRLLEPFKALANG